MQLQFSLPIIIIAELTFILNRNYIDDGLQFSPIHYFNFTPKNAVQIQCG